MSRSKVVEVDRASGSTVEGEALVSREGFSPRYDLDRWTGEISRPGHSIEGENIADKILIVPSAKGGIAAGWAFHDLKSKGIAPKAIIFGVTNPVVVQGAVFAGITITEGWSRNLLELTRAGDAVRVDLESKRIEITGG